MRYEDKTVLAHRLIYVVVHRLTLDSIADQVVRHDCDNPACINPEHLSLGTQADNIADAIARGRARHRTPEGTEHHAAKLTDEVVRAIRQSTDSARVAAERFGVSRGTVKDVRRRRTWRHI
jgi:DNA-binding transcriptional regulator YiaG